MSKLSLISLAFAFLAGCALPEKQANVGKVEGAGDRIESYWGRQIRELEKVAETRRTDEGIVTTLKSNLLFDSGSAELKSAAIKNIYEIADILKRYPEDLIVVVGHADNRGSASLNQTLSERRAETVKRQLISRGLSTHSLSAMGRGSEEPLASNDTDEGRAKNRRVELVISVDEMRFK